MYAKWPLSSWVYPPAIIDHFRGLTGSFLGLEKRGSYQETVTTAYPVKHGKTKKIHGIQSIEIFKKKNVFSWATGYSLSKCWSPTQLCNSSSHARSTAAEARKVAPYSNKCKACCHWAASARLRSTWDDNARWWWSSWWSWWSMMITRMPPCLLAYLPSLHCPTYSLFFTQISQNLPVYSCQSIDKSPPLFLVFLKGHSWDCQKKHERWWFCQLTFSDKDSEGQMRPHTWRASLHVSIATCWFRAYSQVSRNPTSSLMCLYRTDTGTCTYIM